MACDEFKRLIPLFSEGELTEEQEIYVAEHVSTCEECQKLVEEEVDEIILSDILLPALREKGLQSGKDFKELLEVSGDEVESQEGIKPISPSVRLVDHTGDEPIHNIEEMLDELIKLVVKYGQADLVDQLNELKSKVSLEDENKKVKIQHTLTKAIFELIKDMFVNVPNRKKT